MFESDGSERGLIVYFDTDDIDASIEKVHELGGEAEEKTADPSRRLVRALHRHRGERLQPLPERRVGRHVTAAAVALATLAGLAGSVQVAVMGRFGGRIGIVEALTFATGIQLLLAVAVLLVARQGAGQIGSAFDAPPWMWIGGLMGLIVVFSITFAQPQIGATATIGILIAGQLAMGAVIDRFGLFGVDQIAISWPRALGIVLLGAGAALSLAR